MTERSLLGGCGGDPGLFATAGASIYFGLVGRAGLSTGAGSTTEAYTQFKVRGAGTLRNFHVFLTFNSRPEATVFKIRKNGADTGVSISAGAGLTGTFSDLVNSVSVADGDLISAVGTLGAGAGSITLSAATAELTTTAQGFTHVGQGIAALGVDYTTTGGTTFLGLGSLGTTGAEARQQVRVAEAATFSNLQIYVATNSRAQPVTVRFRKNGANGNQVITIGAGQTGLFEDTTNSDTVVAGDLINFSITHGVGTEAFNFRSVTAKRVGVANSTLLAATLPGSTLAAGATTYFVVAGYNNGGGATEARHQTPVPFPGTLSKAAIGITVNASTTDVTYVLRKNGVDTAIVVTVPAGQTGQFTDLTHTVAVARGDLINWKASGATTGALTMGGFAVLLVADAVVACADVAIGSPVFGSPSISQVHSLTVANFTVSALSFGVATITQAHALTCAAVAIGSPVFGNAVLTQTHVLTCAGLTIGSPVFGASVLVPIGTPMATLQGVGRLQTLTGRVSRDLS